MIDQRIDHWQKEKFLKSCPVPNGTCGEWQSCIPSLWRDAGLKQKTSLLFLQSLAFLTTEPHPNPEMTTDSPATFWEFKQSSFLMFIRKSQGPSSSVFLEVHD